MAYIPYTHGVPSPVARTVPSPMPYVPANASYWPEPQAGGHKSISLERELRDRGLHASANAVANGELVDPVQVVNIDQASVDLTVGSPHRFRTAAYNAHVDAEMTKPVEHRSPRRALAGPAHGYY
eukprot:TRINITY_DN625_c0_g1_i3.p1 TRINITY_DN625_c0_g1~~TRINITY_DN625_c0_g1_i3.p1  ORF type:complete len:125 (+),score=34.69 TRINITY_DN625_c0_g1_i3:67-441(+)